MSKIFLTGGSGFIGGHILRLLSERGHQVTCLARGSGAARLWAMDLPGVVVLEGDFTKVDSWREQVAGHDAVVNAVGIIRETAGATFKEVHQLAPIALFEVAVEANVSKIVQISALGADENAESQFHLTKRAADQRLAELKVPYVVLRPSLVYGPGDHSMTFFLSLAALPITPVPGDGKYLVQPIHVADVAQAACQAIERNEIQGVALDAGGAEPLTFDEMLDMLARRLGKAKARMLHIPWTVLGVVAKTTDALGGRGPISGEELGMLRRGNYGDIKPFIQQFSFTPLGFETGLARRPLSQADRRDARLTHLRIPLRLCVAFIWLATGILSLTVSTDQGYQLLEEIGITGKLAGLLLHGTAWLEIAIGAATAVGWKVRWMGCIQILLMFGFMSILTISAPHHWAHPFGPLTKNIPILGATLVMMAMED